MEHKLPLSTAQRASGTLLQKSHFSRVVPFTFQLEFWDFFSIENNQNLTAPPRNTSSWAGNLSNDGRRNRAVQAHAHLRADFVSQAQHTLYK